MMLSRPFLYLLTLALASNAFKSHILQARHQHNVVALQARCAPGPHRSPAESLEVPPSIPDDPTESSPSSDRTVTIASDNAPLSDGGVGDDDGGDGDGEPSSGEGPSDPSGSLVEDRDSDPLISAKSVASLTPNGIKAGIAGGDAYPYLKDHIGWWYDWSPNPSKPGRPIAVPMLWGGGTADAQDAARLAAFKKIKNVPRYVLGFEEPDCPPGSGSAGMSVDAAVSKWEAYIAPMKQKGALLVSPSMCKQADETWLAEFQKKIRTPWDITAIHVNKNNLAGVKKDIDHYLRYGKPIWVTEFACVNDNPNFVPCTNQAEIDRFINEIVPYLERHPKVYAYAYSNGLGLGNKWPLTTPGDNKLTPSGRTYLAAISKFH
ncbi:hypothetical protein E4U52_000979 [Claviceps spartinae]|uniref:Asl1-like glycosyl hydrolase catalytic domain-containing protein n=1 Tax=Coprinopsis cinerea (strain Okayama-7 / 130 / ATCC MYA-4618 / FGSC 9003) TaxID=240176 RepID=A8NT44_COPC7|nr:hypothetical protein CC1G_10935 [Coprinopsis cinerea okayama7\|eukprot:XP_001836154.1 hypothetical protein CC1G_10935 [Coprinopsis cinerea okayama7\